VDYGFVPVTDKVTGWLNEMAERRVPKTIMRTASEVRGFIEGLNDDLGSIGSSRGVTLAGLGEACRACTLKRWITVRYVI
jgi:hypothetical protein